MCKTNESSVLNYDWFSIKLFRYSKEPQIDNICKWIDIYSNFFGDKGDWLTNMSLNMLRACLHAQLYKYMYIAYRYTKCIIFITASVHALKQYMYRYAYWYNPTKLEYLPVNTFSISQTSYFFKAAGWSTKLTWYAYDLTWISKHDLLSYKVWITTKNSINFNFKIYTDLEVFFLWRFILSKNGHDHPCSPLKMHTPLTRYQFTTDMRTSV